MNMVRACLMRVRITSLFGLVMMLPLIAAAQTGQSIFRYDSIHHPTVAPHGMVVSQNDTATRVGQAILARGGNAIDATVAVGFALAVTLPRAGNLGGSGFMLIHHAATGGTVALDYRSRAPLSISLDQISDGEGDIDWDKITLGPMAAGVPGTVAGLHAAWERYGSLPWSELLQPARDLAHNGIRVSHDLAFALSSAQKALSQFEHSKSIFLDDEGQSLGMGATLKQEALARSIAQIQEGGADAFYRGELGRQLVDAVQKAGGIISVEDLADYSAKWRRPVITGYRNHAVVSMSPVSAGGVTLVQMLNMLGNFDLSEWPQGSAGSAHLLAEVMKRAAANRRTHLGDPDFETIAIEGYTSKELAKEMAEKISLKRAGNVDAIRPEDVQQYESRETTHFSVMDRFGNAVSNTYTLGYSFGSGYVAGETGILLDNQVRNFSYRDGPDHPNALEPGKRMLSTMTPTLVLKPDGSIYLATGTPGGSRIINVVLQILVNVIDYDLNIAEATHRPRIHQGWRSQTLGLETGFNSDSMRLLENKGHEIEVQRSMGSTQSILFKDGLFYGSADPRRPNALALGVNELPLD